MELTLFTEDTELNASDISLLEDCEKTIEQGLQTFQQVGQALLTIRDGRLYRKEHGTFEEYCQERWGMSRRHANRLVGAAEVMENLGPIGPKNIPLPSTESQARELSRLEPEQQAQAWQVAVSRAPDSKPTAAQVREVVQKFIQHDNDDAYPEIDPDELDGTGGKYPPHNPIAEPKSWDEYRLTPDNEPPLIKPHVANNSGNNEWYTPPEFIEAARACMGSIDTDPASSEIANQRVKAGQFFNQEINGLEQTWSGNVWMNPPYAQPLINDFAQAVSSKYQSGEIIQAIVLVNNATETAWFQTMMSACAAICFPKSRIRFIDPEGNPSGAPLQGQALLYFGEDVQKFTQNFSAFGAVLYV